jgi:hypothetical protein
MFERPIFLQYFSLVYLFFLVEILFYAITINQSVNQSIKLSIRFQIVPIY